MSLASVGATISKRSKILSFQPEQRYNGTTSLSTFLDPRCFIAMCPSRRGAVHRRVFCMFVFRAQSEQRFFGEMPSDTEN